MADQPLHPETLLAHLGLGDDPETRAIVPPLHLSTTFVRNADGTYPQTFAYSRAGNPTRQLLETELARLEHGTLACAYASGNAAAAAVFMALRPGDHVIVPREMYHGVRTLLREVLMPWGLEVTMADQTQLSNLEAAIRPNTRLIWVETPSNPELSITDIAGVVALAKPRGIRVAVDNTFSTPLLTNPLKLGADTVMHSLTKYLNGHSDVIGGALVHATDDEFAQRTRALQAMVGGVPSPMDCWLVMRGMRSLAARMRMHCTNAAAVAAYLDAHPKVERVLYPGLPSHPNHKVATSQMHGGFGGMVSLLVRGGEAEAMAVAARTKLFVRATSLGGPESLIEHRASVEGPDTPTPANLLRLSIGLENTQDLVADLAQALG